MLKDDIKTVKEWNGKKKTIVIRGIDLATTEKEVEEALIRNSEGELQNTGFKINTLKEARNGNSATATATVDNWMKMKEIKIGWVKCRIDEIVIPHKCYNCQGYGHWAKDCKSETTEGRVKRCRNCGAEDGHLAVD